jgi:hypothetical protein
MSAYASLTPPNPSFLSSLSSLIASTPSLHLYSIDLLAGCEYLPLELEECSSSTCEIYPLDEDVSELHPEITSADSSDHAFRLDGWARMDMPNEDYYSIVDYTESYTEYDGGVVWRMIHDKICFQDKYTGADAWRFDVSPSPTPYRERLSWPVRRSGARPSVISGRARYQPNPPPPDFLPTPSSTPPPRLSSTAWCPACTRPSTATSWRIWRRTRPPASTSTPS